MLSVVDGLCQGSVQGWIDGRSPLCHNAAEGQLASYLLCLLCTADAFTAEEDIHDCLWIPCTTLT